MLEEGRFHLISLPGAVDRQRQVMEWCGRYGLSRQIFRMGMSGGMVIQCPDLRSGSRQTADTFRRYGRDRLQPAEYGCQMSHRAIYAAIRDGGTSWALVLEDDVRPVEPDWPGMLESLCARIASSALADQSWVCHLGLSRQVLACLALRPVRWRLPFPSGPEDGGGASLPAIGQLDPSVGRIWTTHAYLISHRAAVSILENEPEMTYVADDWDVRLRRGLIHPMLATLAPFFLPLEGMQSQIPKRTQFRHPSRRSWMPSRQAADHRGDGGGSLFYRTNRKLRTLLYRSGIGSVTY